MEGRLFALQRLAAMAMVPFVLVHIALIVYAVKTGLTAQALLARTQGSVGWIAFYGLFVIAVALHVPIGIRNVLVEWVKLPRGAAGVVALLFGIALLLLGLRAVGSIGGLMS